MTRPERTVRAADRTALRAAAACVLGFALTLALAYGPHFSRWLDAQSLAGFMSLRGGSVSEAGRAAGSLTNAAPYLGLALLIVVWGVWSRAHQETLVAVVVLTSAPVIAKVLKAALADERIPAELRPLHVAAAAFPSGHATGAMALALAGVLVARSPWRRLWAVRLGAAFTVVVSVGLLLSGSHLPSDVLAAYLVTTAACLFVLALAPLGRDQAQRRSDAAGSAASSVLTVRTGLRATGAACAAAVLASLVRNGPQAILDDPAQTAALVIGAGTLVGAALGLLAVTSAVAARPAMAQ